MKEIYRIKKGNIIIQHINIPFYFGLVFEEDGLFYFDLYVEEEFDLLYFINNEEKIHLKYNFSLKAKTDKNDVFEATELSIRNVIPHQSIIKLQSYGYIKHIDVKDNNQILDEDNNDKNQTIYYLEIEGLKMEYTDLTETIKARGGIQINEYNDWERDHTTAILIFNNPNKFNCNNFKLTFFPCQNSNNINVQLPNFRENGNNLLSYNLFKEFKNELISFLSFLNGAEVAIRKEFLGGYYNIEKVNTQTIITYSFKALLNERQNKYIPINNPFYRSEYIINFSFINCFDKYVIENQKFDLNSIVFYLNGAEQSSSIEEKFFILIIALERLAQKYVETLDNPDALLLKDEIYQPIKDELLHVLNKYCKGENKSTINILKAKIGELHKIKRTSTEYKFKRLLEYANITITPEIQIIIDEARHKSVHHGEIGNGSDGLKNFLVLDELIRDIILNIVGYNKTRLSRYR